MVGDCFTVSRCMGKFITPRHQRINICKFEEQKMPQPMLKSRKPVVIEVITLQI